MDYTWGNAWKIIRGGTGTITVYTQSGLPTGIVDFGEDEDGELYAASEFDGTVYRVGATVSMSFVAEAGSQKSNAIAEGKIQ
ncbi:MAG: hypothetical protein ABI861_13950 [Panacibacter sp.]